MLQKDVIIEQWEWENLEQHYASFFDLYAENTQGHENEKVISLAYIEKKAEEIQELFKKNQVIFLAAIIENQLAGYLWAYQRTFIETPRICLNSMLVDKRFRGNKIGEKLMLRIEEIAKSLDIKEIDVSTATLKQNTIDWYQRLGYIPERVQLFKKI